MVKKVKHLSRACDLPAACSIHRQVTERLNGIDLGPRGAVLKHMDQACNRPRLGDGHLSVAAQIAMQGVAIQAWRSTAWDGEDDADVIQTLHWQCKGTTANER